MKEEVKNREREGRCSRARDGGKMRKTRVSEGSDGSVKTAQEINRYQFNVYGLRCHFKRVARSFEVIILPYF